MRKTLIIAVALACAGSGIAHAQLLGGGVTGGVGGTVGGTVGGAMGGIDAGATATGNARVDPSPALNGATGTVRNLDDSARKASRDAARRADRATADASRSNGSVKAGAGVRVAQGTRCYAYDDYDRASPYDPYYRDGYYYCERTGPSASLGARVKTR